MKAAEDQSESSEIVTRSTLDLQRDREIKKKDEVANISQPEPDIKANRSPSLSNIFQSSNSLTTSSVPAGYGDRQHPHYATLSRKTDIEIITEDSVPGRGLLSVEELIYIEMNARNRPVRITQQGKSVSSDKLLVRNTMPPKKTELSTELLSELSQLLDDVKGSVEELLLEAVQEDVSSQSALTVAKNMRYHLKQLIDFTNSLDDGPLKTSIIYLTNTAKSIMITSLETVKHRLAGDDAKPYFLSLKQTSGEFTHSLLIISKLF